MTLIFAHRFRPSLDIHSYSSLKKWNRSCVRKFALRIIRRQGIPIVERRRIHCNQWGCDVCGYRRAERLREEIINEAKKHGLSIGLDLTLGPINKTCPANSFRRLKQAWSKFRHAMNRLPGKKLEFIWVVGVSEMGEAHLHLLVNKFIEQRLLSEIWRKSGGGPVIHVRKVEEIVPRADYMSCNCLSHGFLKGSRRFGNSKGIKLKVRSLVAEWEVVPKVINLDVLLHGKKVLHCRRDSEGNVVYAIFKERYNPRREEE